VSKLQCKNQNYSYLGEVYWHNSLSQVLEINSWAFFGLKCGGSDMLVRNNIAGEKE